jgi:peptidoglycan hydrolase-like protein with peptidoglycan-binding domain
MVASEPLSVLAQTAQTGLACLMLQSNLGPGDTDSNASGPVTMLQVYLLQRGYLKAEPNGHFGPATTAAVKALQSNNSILVTGTVGPVTRAAIQKRSCSAVSTVVASAAPVYDTSIPGVPASPVTVVTPSSTGQVTPVVDTSPVALSNPVTIISPASGDTLTTGQIYNIAWNVPTNYPYNIVLEEPGGAGAGFIATNLSGGSGYSWRAGTIFSTATQSNQTVATGTYRIHIEQTSGGVSSADPVSGWFTVVGAPLAINSVTPSTIPADGHTVGVIYGNGFDSSSIVYLDQQYGTPATLQYVSADGTVIVFTIPTTISAGYHTVLVQNGAGSISTGASIQVTAAVQ